MNYAIGIDLGGTMIKFAAVAENGAVLQQLSRATRDRAKPDWAETVRAALEELRETLGAEPQAIGLAAPGLAAHDERSIAWMVGKMEGLQGFDWAGFLGRPVRVLNDAHAALLAEVWQGAAVGERDVVLLTLGTGIGGAILSDGRLIKGRLHRAGHLGHICIDANRPPGKITPTPGCLEDAIGNGSLPARSGGRFTSTHDLLVAHRAGDQEATGIWLRSVHLLACGLCSIINALDPDKVILGGGIAEAGEELFKPLRASMDIVEWRPFGDSLPIVPAKLGGAAGAIGAAWYAAHEPKKI